MDELKPCPFCGSTHVSNAGFWRFAIKCHHCGAKSKPSSNWDDAVESWNSRALTATQAYADDMFKILSDIRNELWRAINKGEQDVNISVVDIQNVIDAIKDYKGIQPVGYGVYFIHQRNNHK